MHQENRNHLELDENAHLHIPRVWIRAAHLGLLGDRAPSQGIGVVRAHAATLFLAASRPAFIAAFCSGLMVRFFASRFSTPRLPSFDACDGSASPMPIASLTLWRSRFESVPIMSASPGLIARRTAS